MKSFPDMKSTRKIKNYDLFSGYSFFIPTPGNIFTLTILFLVGALLGNVIGGLFLLVSGPAAQDYMLMVSYPVMFIPPMMYALSKSRSNALFESGLKIDSLNFGTMGGLCISSIVMVATLSLAYLMDMVNAAMPPMPSWLESVMKNLTQGHFWVNLICVSVFAPFFEEWLCRGMVLRGLLYYTKDDGDGRRGMKPAYAIILSALFFAIIHLNPWQAIPAFCLGCLFGYVYYRTGSLRLTMLMHCTNNTMALIIGNIDSLKDVENLMDIMPVGLYLSIAAVCAVILYICVRTIGKIEISSPQGNCDKEQI